MPLKRFEEIRTFLYFNDNDLMLPKDDPSHDRAFKIRPVLGFLTAVLLVECHLQNTSLDEHMLKFKGYNILKQYVKGKPIPWGFKLWCRCD